MWRGLILTGLLAVAPPGFAQDSGVADPLLSVLSTLPQATAKRLRQAPERMQAETLALIHGYGTNGSIGAEELERFIALERAAIRARTLRPLLEADLDNDGSVSGDEVRALAATLSAEARGRLMLAHAAADAGRDGTADAGELRSHAASEAQEKLSEADAAALRVILAFDLDGDGRTDLAEVGRIMAQLMQDA
jgi:Ca2+-binding EF-hand superfamily protein